MQTQEILLRARQEGITLKVEGDRLLYHPASAASGELVATLRQYKSEVIKLLISQSYTEMSLQPKAYRLKYPDARITREELEQIAQRVKSEGYVLLWSTVLDDLVAFYHDEESRGKIPPGFVPYREGELNKLFGGHKQVSIAALKLIHEAKKAGGAKVTSCE